VTGLGGPALQGFARVLGTFARAALWTSGAGLVAMTVAIGWQVFGRFVLNDTPTWTEPLSLLLMLYYILLAAAVGVHQRFHPSLDLFRSQAPGAIRRGLDAVNHVNNSKYLSYLEEARLRWMLSVPGMGMDDNVAPVVAASNLGYRRPIGWPGDVVVELFVERIGGSSLTIGHRIVDSKDGNVLYCDGNVGMVWIDRNTGRSAPLPDDVRAACR